MELGRHTGLKILGPEKGRVGSNPTWGTKKVELEFLDSTLKFIFRYEIEK
jgi:hypothetical protein